MKNEVGTAAPARGDQGAMERNLLEVVAPLEDVVDILAHYRRHLQVDDSSAAERSDLRRL